MLIVSSFRERARLFAAGSFRAARVHRSCLVGRVPRRSDGGFLPEFPQGPGAVRARKGRRGARAFQAWRVGRRVLDDGAALFDFAYDRRARIEVGYGLESRLTDADSARLISTSPVAGAGSVSSVSVRGVDRC